MISHQDIEQACVSIPKPEAYRASMDAFVGKRASEFSARVKKLFVYPIKGLPGISFQDFGDEVLIDNFGASISGILRDRMAMVVRLQKGNLCGEPYDARRVSQKDCGHLAKMNLEYDNTDRSLFLYSRSAPGITPIQVNETALVSHHNESDAIRIKLTNEVIDGMLLPEEDPLSQKIAELLAYFGEKVDGIRIAVPHPLHVRPAEVTEGNSGEYVEHATYFSDGAQLHIYSQEDLDWLNEGLKEKHGRNFRSMTHAHFRPNIVFDELPPNAMDVIKRFRLDMFMGVYMDLCCDELTPRCAVPQRNPLNGDMYKDKEPNAWLLEHRPKKGNKMTFGVNAHTDIDTDYFPIRVGDIFQGMRS